MRSTTQRASGLAATVALTLIVIGAMNGTASSSAPSGKEVVITDPVDPGRQATVEPSGALRVEQQGTADVSVTNTPLAVSQQGPWMIGGDVQLAPAEPVRKTANGGFDSTEKVEAIEVYTVPDGKSLVVEHASILALLGAGNLYSAELEDGFPFGSTIHHLVIAEQGQDDLGRSVWTAGEDVRFMLEPGTTLSATVRRDAAGAGSFVEVTISGYLVDA
ncbi:MAG: hypothetical protein ACRDH9_03790 [Actinomycetota bacterium]